MALKRAHAPLQEAITTTVLEATSSALPPLVPPPLKLRVKHQSLSQKLSVDIYDAKNDREKHSAMIKFLRTLNYTSVSPDECEQLMRTLKETVKREASNPVIRSKAIELMGKLCVLTGANKLLIVEDIFDSLHKENSHIVITNIFKTLLSTATLISNKSDIIQKILKAAIKKLDDLHQDVRCACLQLIGRICTAAETIKISSTRSIDPLELFSEFTADQDPRVRAVVFRSLLNMHQRGHTLDVNLYEKVCKALNDDFEEVRLSSITLIWVFSHIHPEGQIAYNSKDTRRLMDDAFVKICSMVNDISMQVRARAVGLLGSMHDVDLQLLEQTLDKKLMSKGRKTKSFNERAAERFRGTEGGSSSGGGGGWSTGKTWGDKTPMSSAEDEVKLMNTGACGVFVRALEDEFKEVRTAGVDSMCELANQCAAFARLSTDFLVDMFNDEIEAVRLNSVTSLIKIHEHVDLREDQLDTILECLNDANVVVRDSVRDLLAHCVLSTQACLHATVLALLNNLNKYPNDNESIWRCMKQLGLRHAHFVAALVPELLTTHAFYAVPEPNINDPSHIAVATLVFNAESRYQPVGSLLPPYAPQHRAYLRDSVPHLIPQLTAAKVSNSDTDYDSISQFFKSAVLRMSRTLEITPTTTSSASSSTTLNSCMKDFQHVRRLHPAFAPASEFLTLYLQCQQTLIKCRGERTWQLPAAMATISCSSLEADVAELIERSYRLQHLFYGLSNENTNTLRLIRVLAHTLSVLLELRHTSRLHQMKRVDLKLWGSFLQRLHKFKDHVTLLSDTSDNFNGVFTLYKTVEENLSQTATLVGLLQPFFLNYPVKIKVDNRLRRTSAKIIEPCDNMETPMKFCAGLTLKVSVNATLDNVDDTLEIFIKIIYPDLTVQLHKPNPSDFHCITSSKHKLVTSVLLSHTTWTEACYVKLSVVRSHGTDIKEELTNGSESYRGYVELCPAVNVYIQPKALTK